MPHSSTLLAVSSATPQVIRVGSLSGIARRSGWLLLETALIPMLLLYVALRTTGPMSGLIAVLCWRVGLVAGRAMARQRIPATVLLSTSIFSVRTVVSMAFASVTVYLWQPVAMSALMGLFFIGTALCGRPVTLRLAQDVLTFPPALVEDPRMRRIFAQIAIIWGGVHVACAGLGAWSMHWPTQTVVLVQGALGLCCTLGSVGGSIAWGSYRMARLGEFKVRFGADTDPDTQPGTQPGTQPVTGSGRVVKTHRFAPETRVLAGPCASTLLVIAAAAHEAL